MRSTRIVFAFTKIFPTIYIDMSQVSCPREKIMSIPSVVSLQQNSAVLSDSEEVLLGWTACEKLHKHNLSQNITQ